jgi:hypothetical protein
LESKFAGSLVVIGYENGSFMVFRGKHIASSTIISTTLESSRAATLVEG